MATQVRAAQAEAQRKEQRRARAIDATLDADRRLVGEGAAVLFRWLFLIVLGVLNNVAPGRPNEAQIEADIILGAWTVVNVVVNVLLVRGYKPGKQFSLSTMTLDIFFAAGLGYLLNRFSSPFFPAP